MPLIVSRSVFASPGVPGANCRLSVGVIRCGGRVTALLDEAPAELQVVALADCGVRQMTGESTFGKAVNAIPKLAPAFPKWTRYQGYRAPLEKEKVDAVFVRGDCGPFLDPLSPGEYRAPVGPPVAVGPGQRRIRR